MEEKKEWRRSGRKRREGMGLIWEGKGKTIIMSFSHSQLQSQYCIGGNPLQMGLQAWVDRLYTPLQHLYTCTYVYIIYNYQRVGRLSM